MTIDSLSDSESGDLNPERVALLAVGLSSVVIVTAYLLNSQTPVQFSESIKLVNLVTNSVLTIFLILIYLDIARSTKEQVAQNEKLVEAQATQGSVIQNQTDILRKQSEVLEEQARISEYTATPTLAVESYEVERDDFSVWLTNYGESVAKDLSVRVSVFSQDSDISVEPFEQPLLRTEQRGGDIVAPGEENIQFESKNLYGLFDAVPRNESATFRELMANLGEKEADSVGVKLEVKYSGPLDKEYQVSVFPPGRIIETPLPADSLPLGRCIQEGEWVPESIFKRRQSMPEQH